MRYIAISGDVLFGESFHSAIATILHHFPNSLPLQPSESPLLDSDTIIEETGTLEDHISPISSDNINPPPLQEGFTTIQDRFTSNDISSPLVLDNNTSHPNVIAIFPLALASKYTSLLVNGLNMPTCVQTWSWLSLALLMPLQHVTFQAVMLLSLNLTLPLYAMSLTSKIQPFVKHGSKPTTKNFLHLKKNTFIIDQLLPGEKCVRSLTLTRSKSKVMELWTSLKTPSSFAVTYKAEDLKDKWSHTASFSALKMFLAHACHLNIHNHQLDFVGPYLQANIHSCIFIKFPIVYAKLLPGYKEYFGVPLCLIKSMYSMILSGKYWYLNFLMVLKPLA